MVDIIEKKSKLLEYLSEIEKHLTEALNDKNGDEYHTWIHNYDKTMEIIEYVSELRYR